MTPLRGWGTSGERIRGFAPHGRWRTLTFLGALRCDSFTAPFLVWGRSGGHRSYLTTIKTGSDAVGDRYSEVVQPDKGFRVHISAVENAGLNTLNEGAKVSYEEMSSRGKTSAENLRVG
jgi:cold shock CspA family protein